MKCLTEHAAEEKYVLIRTYDQHGLFTLFIAKKTVQTRISSIETCSLNFPYSDSGSKGASIVRFCFDDTSFVFSNCHLDGGDTESNAKTRHGQLLQVQEGAFKQERGTQYQQYDVENHTVKVFFGDLNFCLFPDESLSAKDQASPSGIDKVALN